MYAHDWSYLVAGIGSNVIAFLGYGSAHELVVVVTPARSPMDLRQGVSLRQASLYVGRDGDWMPAVPVRFDDDASPGALRLIGTNSQRLVSPAGVFERRYLGSIQDAFERQYADVLKQDGGSRLLPTSLVASWQAVGALRPKIMRPLSPEHFDISMRGGALRVSSKPRIVRLVGATQAFDRGPAAKIVCITMVGSDAWSAEFFIGLKADGMAVRFRVRKVRALADEWFMLGLEGFGSYTADFSLMPADGARKALPRGFRGGMPRTGSRILCGGSVVTALDAACVQQIDQRDGVVRFAI